MIIILLYKMSQKKKLYPLKNILNLLDNKFKFKIIFYLTKNKMRFGEIKSSLFTYKSTIISKVT